MPRYDYHCKSCEITSTIRHSIKEEVTLCPKCGKEALVRLLSMPFVFRGKTAGKVVEKHIEDAKQELVKDKKEMKKEYK